MESPFWDNIQNMLGKLRGRSLGVAIVVWVVVIGLGLACALGGFALPNGDEPDAVAEDPVDGENEVAQQPTATLPADSIVIPTPTPLPEGEPVAEEEPSLPPLPWGDFGYGIAVQGVIPVAGDYAYSMNQVRDQLGFDWVKQQVRWDDIYPEAGMAEGDWHLYDPVVEAAHGKDLKVMLSVVDAPEWARSYIDEDPLGAPPDDLSLYANFLGELVERYDGKVHAIEVWNEQNLNREWDTAQGLNPERYVEMLRLSYQAIKSRDPDIIVISGALSPTGANWEDPDQPGRQVVMDDYLYLQRMIDAGFLDYADCVGAHHNGINMPPNVAWDEGYDDPTANFRGPFDNPNHSWSFKSTLWDYYTMVQQAGYDKPLCLTEFGWASAQGWSTVAEGMEFAFDNSLEEQAQWNVEAFQLMRQWGFVRLAFLWNLDYAQKGGLGEVDPNAPWSIIDFKGMPRPAYGALGEMPKIP
jgi:hypothetical protein